MNFFHSKKTRAVINDDALAVSFPNANPPLIWRSDLMQQQNFSILARKTDSNWELVMTEPNGTPSVIAHFDVYADAEQAMQALQCALLTVKGNAWRRAGKIIGVLLLIFILWVIVGQLLAPLLRSTGVTPMATTMRTAPQGVPLPADIMLRIQDMQQRVGNGAAVPPPTPHTVPKPPMADGVPQSADDMLKSADDMLKSH